MNGWVALAQAAMNWTSGYLQARLSNAVNAAQKTTDDANTYASNLINNANADAANEVRTANNGLAAAQAAFGNLQRSVSNKNKLTAFGNQLDADSQNLIRIQDSMERGSFEEGLRAAEQLGAMHAQAAAQGVGGATASMLHKTLELSAARGRAVTEEKAGYQTYDMIQQRMGLVRNMVSSVDEGQSFAPIDYNVNVAPLVQSPIRAGDFAGSAASQAWIATLGNGSTIQSLANAKWGGGDTGNSTALPRSTSLDMNDGWNNFSTRSFGDSSTEGLGSGFYGVGGHSNGFFSTGSSDSSFEYKLK